MVKIFKPILVRVVSIRAAVEAHRRRISDTVLIASVLRNIQYMCNDGLEKTYTILLLVEHEGSDGPPGVGAVAGLDMDMNSGTAPAVLILSVGDGTRRHWHGRVSDGRRG